MSKQSDKVVEEITRYLDAMIQAGKEPPTEIALHKSQFEKLDAKYREPKMFHGYKLKVVE